MDDTLEIKSHDFNYMVAPGEAIRDALEGLGMSQAILASHMGCSLKHLNQIIQGKAPIKAETAILLERCLNIPVSFWSNLESSYRAALARNEQREKLDQHLGLLAKYPVKEMTKRGWLPKFTDKRDVINALLSYFGVGKPENLDNVLAQNLLAFRKVKAHKGVLENEAVWLRKGLIDAALQNPAKYNKAQFKDALTKIRALTLEPDPAVSLPKLTQLCNEAGVIVVFTQELPKTGIHGVMRWLNPETAMIQLSARYRRDEHLWFTFFHEAGHILLHSDQKEIIETGEKNEREREADLFALNMLVSPKEWIQFEYAGLFTEHSVKQFARKVGIASGIIVGRLQHDRRIKYHQLNKLKQQYPSEIFNS